MSDVLVLPCMDLTPSFTRTQGQKEDSLEGQMLQRCLRGSKGAFVSWCSTRERFQEGTPLRPFGLSLWKLSKRRVRLSFLLILTVVSPSLSEMEDCIHQWCWAVTSCPQRGTLGSQPPTLQVVT